MDSIEGKWALVTGASSGFGVEFATLLAEQHANLIVVARHADALEQLAERLRSLYGVRVLVEALDLSVASAGTTLKHRLDSQGIAVDILVNNAGYGLFGEFVEQPLSRTLNMLQLNVLAVTELTRVFAADMVRSGSGHILMIASLLGFQGVPGYAAYAASKAYVLHFGEALHEELRSHGVTVTVLAPGASATGFADVAHQRDTGSLRALMMQPRPVARTGIAALLRGRSMVIAGVRNKAIVLSNRFTPRHLQRLIMRRVFAGGKSAESRGVDVVER